jgi:uncharacterized protein (DUF433 family)
MPLSPQPYERERPSMHDKFDHARGWFCKQAGLSAAQPCGSYTRRQVMKERIAVNPNVHFGKPCVAGTRVPVLSVLELVGEGLSFETIVRDYYPELQVEDIRACVRYAMEVIAAEEIHIAVQA